MFPLIALYWALCLMPAAVVAIAWWKGGAA